MLSELGMTLPNFGQYMYHPADSFAPAPLLSFGQEGKVQAIIIFCNSIRDLKNEYFSSWSGGVGFCDKGAKGRGG